MRCVLSSALSRRRKVSYLTAYAFCHHDLPISNCPLQDETLLLHVSTSVCVCVFLPHYWGHTVTGKGKQTIGLISFQFFFGIV